MPVKEGKTLVNTQRCRQAGGLSFPIVFSKERKERCRKIFGKKYIAINKEGKIFRIYGLKSWAEKRGLNYKDLNAVAKEKINSSKGFLVIYREKWKNKTKKEKLKIINDFKNYDPFRTEKTDANHNRAKKTFYILYANGEKEKIFGIQEFCRENNINEGSLYMTLYKEKKFYKGTKLFRSKKDLRLFKNKNKLLYNKNNNRFVKYKKLKVEICIVCKTNKPTKGRICNSCWYKKRKEKNNDSHK